MVGGLVFFTFASLHASLTSFVKRRRSTDQVNVDGLQLPLRTKINPSKKALEFFWFALYYGVPAVFWMVVPAPLSRLNGIVACVDWMALLRDCWLKLCSYIVHWLWYFFTDIFHSHYKWVMLLGKSIDLLLASDAVDWEGKNMSSSGATLCICCV